MALRGVWQGEEGEAALYEEALNIKVGNCIRAVGDGVLGQESWGKSGPSCVPVESYMCAMLADHHVSLGNSADLTCEITRAASTTRLAEERAAGPPRTAA